MLPILFLNLKNLIMEMVIGSLNCISKYVLPTEWHDIKIPVVIEEQTSKLVFIEMLRFHFCVFCPKWWWFLSFIFFGHSLDSRDGFFRTATHWREKTGLGERLNFKTDSSPTLLTINNVQEADEGYYRCRVDFMKSPTRNFKVHLTLIGKYCLIILYSFRSNY